MFVLSIKTCNDEMLTARICSQEYHIHIHINLFMFLSRQLSLLMYCRVLKFMNKLYTYVRHIYLWIYGAYLTSSASAIFII